MTALYVLAAWTGLSIAAAFVLGPVIKSRANDQLSED